MAKKLLSATLVLCSLFGASAEAKLYKWVDDKGETHYGEVIPPEYAGQNKVQLNNKGRVVKEKKEAEEGEMSAEQEAAKERRRKDKALLNTYSNEKEIDLARDRNLQQVEARINGINLMIKSAQESLDGFNREAQDFKKAGKPIPPSLQSDISGAQNKLAKLKKDLGAANEKADSVRAGYEADKVRYRELTGRSGN